MRPLSVRWRMVLRLALIIAALAGLVRLASLDFRTAISTDVIDLLPPAERDPELQLLRGLVDDAQARVLRVVLRNEEQEPVAEPAVEAFLKALRNSGHFVAVERADDASRREELAGFLHRQRLTYLLPDWLRQRRQEFEASGQSAETWPEWLARESVARLERFLARPESGAFEEGLTSDPLLLLPELAEQASAAGWVEPEAATHALIWARTVASPLSESGQEPVFTALEHAFAAASQVQPNLTWRWSGVHRFAASSKARIRQELAWLNGAALASLGLMVALLIRRPWQTLHLLPVAGLSLLAAWLAVLGWFDRVHILVLVLGALLSGAAVDYGFHLGVHAAAGRSWRTVLKPLLASCLTTVLGFALLGASDLPLLRQLGVFVSAGLIAALGAAVAYAAQRSHAAIEARPLTLRFPRWACVALIAAGTVAATGLFRVHWRDDVRDLQVDDAPLRANDAAVRRDFGDDAGRAAYLASGDTVMAARARLQEFLDRARLAAPSTAWLGAGQLLPSPQAWRALEDEQRRLADFPDALEEALRQREFAPGEFRPFFEDWESFIKGPRPAWPELWAPLAERLPGPLLDTAGVRSGSSWFIVLASETDVAVTDLQPGVIPLNRLESLNHLFRRYRHQALTLSLTGLAILAVGVALLYGPVRGITIFLIPAAALAVAFGLLGWSGTPLNLFHLLGAFLGVCLSHDYAIFGEAHRQPGDPAPASVRLSGLTTAASFGVLAFSRINAVASLGLTVTLIVLAALMVVELRARPR